MRVLVLGADGYLGWPTSAAFAARGDMVVGVDNYLRRTMAQQTNSEALLDAPSLPERACRFAERTGNHIEPTSRESAPIVITRSPRASANARTAPSCFSRRPSES